MKKTAKSYISKLPKNAKIFDIYKMKLFTLKYMSD